MSAVLLTYGAVGAAVCNTLYEWIEDPPAGFILQALGLADLSWSAGE
jgi:hypothetical protein